MVLRNKWAMVIVEAAQQDFAHLDPKSQKSVYKKLEAIQKNPISAGKPLRIREGAAGKQRSTIVFTLKQAEQIVEVWAITQKNQTKSYRSLMQRVQKLIP